MHEVQHLDVLCGDSRARIITAVEASGTTLARRSSESPIVACTLFEGCDPVEGGWLLGGVDEWWMVQTSEIVRLDEVVELCVRGSLGGDQAIVGCRLCSHELVELALRHQLLAVLRVLDGEHHHYRDGRRR